jgi:hypothetical protein
VGHLALFVSGKVANREHTQVVSVLESIEALPPGLYAMQIKESKGSDGTTECEVECQEHRLEDLALRLNRFERVDERPFEAVESVSELNQRAYELFGRPLVMAATTPISAWLGRTFHPLRVQHWGFSDLNPWLWWVEAASDAAKAHRQKTEPSHPLRKVETAVSQLVSGALNLHKDVRDAATEALFFQLYGNMFIGYSGEKMHVDATRTPPLNPASLPVVTGALAAVDEGGYAAALARVGELLARTGAPVPLSRIERKAALVKEYAELLPDLPEREWKLTRGRQYNIVRHEPERALTTLPALLADPGDRQRFLQVMEHVTNDREFVGDPTPEQLEMVQRIRKVLHVENGSPWAAQQASN